MALKKSELYSKLWASCDELRGGMDASQYKDYVLVLLFVKYVSDKYAGQKDALVEVPEGASFADMVALKGHKDIGEKIDVILDKLAKPNGLQGVIDVIQFNDEAKLGSGKDMVDRLSNLVGIFEGLDFSRNRAGGDDLLGDAYEYLMRNFATQSGKSKGQFYTPAEVSRTIAQVIGMGEATSRMQTIYDPTCGSGSLLIKAHDEALTRTGFDLGIYGQEMDQATHAMAKMNMFLHDCATAEIWKDNSLTKPQYKEKSGGLKLHDFVVANPPFSTKAWSNGLDTAHDPFNRFDYGTPPAKNGDYAFLLHVLKSLKSTGKGAIILPHGVLFRGNAEAEIRKQIVQRGYIKGIIGLPANLFYGTGIPACIILLDKEKAGVRKGIFMMDASKGFIKDGNKNRLRAQDIHKIVDTFTRFAEIPKYSRMVPLAEISDPKNDYNLNLPRYIDSTEPEDLQDIDGHLKGGIPLRDIDALDNYWKVFPSLRVELFKKADRAGYCRLRVDADKIKPTIFGHAEFTAFNKTTLRLFGKWREANRPLLEAIKAGDKPKQLIGTLSEDLLATFQKAKLLDPYDLYQHLMDYWDEMMQDDLYLLVQEGWQAVLEGKPNTDLIPQTLIIARYFAKEAKEVEKLEADAEAVSQEMAEMAEEEGGEDGLLYEAKTDKEKLTKVSVKARLAAIKDDAESKDEQKILKQYLTLIEKEAEANKQVREAKITLSMLVTGKYSKLTKAEIKELVIDDKWIARLNADVQSEMDRVSQALTGRIKQLAERYATPLPELSKEVNELAARVNKHLKKMGFTWN